VEKIFGFALSKMMDTDKAEELASRITFDVYVSLLKSDSVQNIDGYVYRVAHNVYARFIDEEVKGRHVSLNEAGIPCAGDFTIDFEKDETCIRLRKEISYLGKIRREIVVMHYFQKLKLREIARRLNIPLGTVKWHLYDAKNQIREGIAMREEGTLGMKPIKFTSMGISGSLSPDGKGTGYYLAKLISQNIAYAAYHEAKTISEIAVELGVPAAFVEDEVAYLEDNGFMDKAAGGKYLTNIYITELLNEIREQEHKIYSKYAKMVCETYVPLVFDAMTDFKQKNIYSPQDDFNFLMWSAVTYACGVKLRGHGGWTESKYRVKHKDGGEYTALAWLNLDESKLSFDDKLYDSFGDSYRWWSDVPLTVWWLDTYYDDRKDRNDNDRDIYGYLYNFITGKITKDPVHADKFKRLFDKGYLVSKGDSEYVNMVITALSKEKFSNLLPVMPEALRTVSDELDAQIFAINKANYPPHMQDVCRSWCKECLSKNAIRTHVLEQLAAAGTLKPLSAAQKHSVNTIMFCDTLPK